MSIRPAPRTRRARVLTIAVPALVAALMTPSVASPTTPTPVRADPGVSESAPSSYGQWFAWSQDTRARPDHTDFFVQRGSRPRTRVNAPGTEALGGDVLATSAIYVQQRGTTRPQLYRFDLRTGRRAPLPPAANRATYRKKVLTIGDDVSASGPWVLFKGTAEVGISAYQQLLLYNRVSRKLRTVASVNHDFAALDSFQVNGSFLTFQLSDRDFGSSITRVDTRTNRRDSISSTSELGGDEPPYVAVSDPAVSSDGTWYYWRRTETSQSGDPSLWELVRQPANGPEQVVLSTTDQSGRSTFVKDRPDGSRYVFYELDGDIYRVLDRP